MVSTLLDNEVYILGYENRYILNKETKEVYRSKTGTKLKKGILPRGTVCTVALKSNVLNKYVNIPMISLLLTDKGTDRVEKLYPIAKDNNHNNLDENNILLGDIYVKYYYKYCHNDIDFFNTFLKDRCSLLTDSVTEAVSKGLIPVRNVDGNHRYLIDTEGNIFSKTYGRLLKRKINDKGYLSVGLLSSSDKVVNINIIRLIAEAFIPKPLSDCNVVRFKVKSGRDEADINNLIWCTRSEASVNYHTMNPEHSEKYLCNTTHATGVIINGIEFPTVTLGAKYIIDDLKQNHDIVKLLSTVRSGVSNRANGKFTSKKLYDKYDIKRMNNEEGE